MTDTVKFLKVRDVKSPDRACNFDAGIDFYVPRFNAEFIKDLKEKNPDIFGKSETSYSGNVYIGQGNVTAYATGCGTLTISGKNTSVVYNMDDDNKTVIKFDDEKGFNYFLLAPHQRVLIPSGIKSRMANPGRALIAANKSGVATKLGLIIGACIDGETIIETNKGKFTAKTLTKEFIDQNNILIKGYDEKTKIFNYYKFDGFRISGEKSCIKILLDNNEELICSEDHLLLTEKGWKQAIDILETDTLIQ